MEEAELEKQCINHIKPEILKKFQKKQRLPPTSHDTANRVLSTYYLFLKILFGMKAPQKQGMNALQPGLLNMSEQGGNVGADCLAHVFWGLLDDSCRHFINPLSPESARARYMNPKSVWLPRTRLGHMAEKWHVTSH